MADRAQTHRRRATIVAGFDKVAGALLTALFVTFLMVPTSARAWWNDEWQVRKKITIDTSTTAANITQPIGGAVVLVRLHLGNFRFAAAKDHGEDIRFIASDDKTPLKYSIEKYDPLLGEGLLWVALPEVKPGAKTEFWLYYANKKAIPAEDVHGTYDADTLLVYHFKERGTPPQDSSIWANNAQSVGQVQSGAIIGQGLKLDGHQGLSLPGSPSLGLSAAGALTWSAWIRLDSLQANAALYTRHDGGSGLVVGVDGGAPFVEVNNAGAVQRSAPGAPVAVNSWHHLAVVAGSGKLAIYLDGKAYTSLATTLPKLTSPSLVGADTPVAVAAPVEAPADASAAKPEEASGGQGASGQAASGQAASGQATGGQATGGQATGSQTTGGQPSSAAPAPADGQAAATPPPAAAPAAMAAFVGAMDELQISKVARPEGLIRFEAIGQGPDQGKLISFSTDEETGGWLSGYFGIILKSVTLDGWVVIGLLMVLGAISTVVMIDKTSFLNKQVKGNARFLVSFREFATDLTVIGSGSEDDIASLGGRLVAKDAKRMRRSSIYRIYQIGATEVHDRMSRHGLRSQRLSAPSVAAIRATMDSGVVKELQRLNRAMVVLTIAISGGPFLGLLGTVVGVMITFAAIAASGDVNVNAIAPGIAAALVATVAGLAVAIPALFGYNYLISKIKDLTSDIHVFVDEFVTRVAEVYSSDQPAPADQRREAA